MSLRKAGVWLGLVEQDDEVLYETEPEGEEATGTGGVAARPSGARRYGWEPPPTAVREEGGFQLAVVTPRTFRDAHTIGEYFRHEVPVIIDLHDVDMTAAKRIVDFACGLTFGRRGDIERLSSRMYLILPPGSTLLKEHESAAGTTFFNQA